MHSTEIAENLADVRRRIAEAAIRAGRRPDAITLVAVSKTFPLAAILEAHRAGQVDFGENKVQEGLQKIGESAEMRIRWHLVGHLQSNKARKAAAAFHWIHSVDSLDLLNRLDEGAQAAGRRPSVLVQVDLSREPTKYGAVVNDVPRIVEAARACRSVELKGLMVLPPFAEDREAARPWFRQLRELRDRLVAEGTPADRLAELSMGMSHDFDVAIEESATIVRVGTAIFGSRDGHRARLE
jgi:PLP dependent protein